jgi:UDP-2,4-diacetamido-2,4,6-trideoxy-beta-L-altropyranose hydrolase
MKRKLIIRADANTQIGTGHTMRCIALAQAWQDRGGNVTFLSHCESKALHQRIVDEGFEFIPIEKPHPAPRDLEQVLKQLETRNSKLETWFVLDGYHFTPDYQKAIRKKSCRLLVIDDMAHLDHYDTDILLNQNIHASSLLYVCNNDTVKLLGCEYVLLRREFLKYKDWKREIPDKAKNILVTMGGSDPDNVTVKVIEALKLLNKPDITVRIIIGPANPHKEMLRKAIISADFKIELLIDPSNIPELMSWADLAISAGGSTCWEMAFMGLPNIIIVIADNQSGIAKGLSNAGAGINWGWHENITLKQCTQKLKEIAEDKSKRICLSEQGKRLLDGKGRQRVIRAMVAGQIKLRRVEENDCELLWKWANDPIVRQSSFNSKDIAWQDHHTWFLNKQNDTNCIQYIAISEHNVPIGQIRFDVKDSIADIGYSIAQDFRGMGLGQMLLKKGIELFCSEQENILTIQGCVKKGNMPSRRSFQDVGFLESRESAVDGNDVTSTRSKIIYNYFRQGKYDQST